MAQTAIATAAWGGEDKMNYSDLLKQPNFQNVSAIIRRALTSVHWKRQHREVPFWLLWNKLNAVTPLDTKWNKTAVISAFTELLMALADADESLRYSTDDMTWLVSVIDDQELNKVTISLLKAYATAPDEFLTPAEAAELTNTHESGWRNRAAAGEIPGAFKKGKQWLIPRSAAENNHD